MKVSFYLLRPTMNVEGKIVPATTPTVIFARICYEGQKIKYYLPESISPLFWNSATHRAKETRKFPEHPEFNRRLDNIEAAIKNIVRRYINDHGGKYPTPTILKPLLDKEIRNGGKGEKVTFLAFYREFITRCEQGTRIQPRNGKPITAGTIKNYETTLTTVENYIKDSRKSVDFDSMDMNFYTDFTKYLTVKCKLSTNYIGKHIRVIKTILREASDMGIETNTAFRSRSFTAMSEETQKVYLATHELKELEELDLSEQPRLDAIRDLFLVGCYTGLRFSDLSTLQPAQISGGMITLTQIKTGKPVIIPVHDVVSRVMTKYSGHLPAARSNQKTNDYLKELCKMDKVKSLKAMVSVSITKGGATVTTTVPKHTLVTTHTARRSFATNEYLAGTPTLTIMAITGHKTEKAFLKYIRVTPDEHAKILQTIWSERKNKPLKTIAI